jgi:hypothetical protein
MPNDNLKKYYSYLKSNGADVAPTYEAFANALSDENNAKKYHSYLLKNKFDAPQSYDVFSQKLGIVKKKETTVSPSEQKQAPISSGTQPKVTQKPSATSVSQKDKDREGFYTLESKDAKVYTGLPGKEKTQYRVLNNKWQRRDESGWRDLDSKNSIDLLNTYFNKTVKSREDITKGLESNVKKAEVEKELSDKELASVLGWSEQEVKKSKAGSGSPDKDFKAAMVKPDMVKPSESNAIGTMAVSTQKAYSDLGPNASSEDIKKKTKYYDTVESQKYLKSIGYDIDVNGDESDEKTKIALNKEKVKQDVITKDAFKAADTYESIDNEINQDLLLNNEEFVVTELRKKYSKDGFYFEETGAGDSMIVKYSPIEGVETRQIEIPLNTNDINNVNTLKDFMKQSYMTASERKNLNSEELDIRTQEGRDAHIDKLLKLMADNPYKYGTSLLSEDEIENHINNSYSNLKQESKNLQQEYKDLQYRIDKFNQDPSNPQEKAFINNKIHELSQKELQINNRYNDLSSVDKSINKVASINYDKSKQPGNWIGVLGSQFVQGITNPEKTLTQLSMDVLPYAVGEDVVDPMTRQKLKDQGYTDIQILDYASKELKNNLYENLKEGITNVSSLGTTTSDYVNSKDRNDLLKAASFLAESIGTSLSAGGNPTLQKVAFFTQSYNSMEEQMVGPEFDSLNEWQKKLISVPYGFVIGALERYGIAALGEGANPIVNRFATAIVNKTMLSLPKDATVDTIKREINKSVGAMIAQGALKVAGGSLVEGGTEATQQLFEIGEKFLVNKIVGSDKEPGFEYFKDVPDITTADGLKKAFEIAGTDFYYGALGGLLMSGGVNAYQTTKQNSFNKKTDQEFEAFYDSMTDDKLRKLNVLNTKIKLKNGEITKQEAKETIDAINSSSQKLKSLNPNLSLRDKKDAFNLMLQRDKLEQEKAPLDEAMQAPYNERITNINNELKTISENAIKESNIQQQEVTAEGGGLQLEGVNEGQPQVGEGEGAVGETAQPETDLGNRPVEGRGIQEEGVTRDVINRPSTLSEFGGNTFDTPLQGDTYVDGQQVVFEDRATGRIYELGNIDEVMDSSIPGLQAQEETISITPEGKVSIEGNNWNIQSELPTQGIEYNPAGEVTRVSLKDDAGNTQMFDGQQAVDIAYQIELQKIQSPEQQQFINDLLEQDEEFQTATESIKPRQIEAVVQEEAVTDTVQAEPTVAEEVTTEEAVTPEVQAEVESLGNLLEGTDQQIDEQVGDLRVSKSNNKVAQSIANAAKAIAKILPSVKFVVHDTDASYRKATNEEGRSQSSSGEYNNKTKTIHINASKANNRTAAHEVFHAILLNKIGSDIELQRLTKAMIDSVLKSLPKTKGSEEVVAYLEKFASQYDDKTIFNEEKLAELFGILADNYAKLPAQTQNIIQRFIDRVRKILGLKPMTDKEVIDFMNTISQKVARGQEITTTDVKLFGPKEQGDGGEVGTFSIPRQQKQTKIIEAPSVKNDARSFIRNIVEDVDIREFNGKPFVTNMYDYTNAGETDLGNGLILNLFGGKGYVPYMMELKGKNTGDVSNLAAFNTKAQAETFIRNSINGNANLFAPHSGTLDQSWQFQQHMFAELIDLILKNNILSNAELIKVFNDTIKTNEKTIKAFDAFKNKYGKDINNFDSFESNPKEIVTLLDIKNNYSPDLRKALNNSIPANKKFKQAIGVNNKEQFYKRIMDPLNEGVEGGEIMSIVKFDPNTFEIVETKPGDIDHHPSFGWTLLAKIDGVYQPTQFYKSYDITDTYTKYNKDKTEVSRKTEQEKFAQKNVSSSAGAIPKVAEVKVEQEENIDSAVRKQKADTISGMVFTARQNGFSDAAISQYLLSKGYTQEQIDGALSAKAGTKNIDDIFEASEQEIRDKVKRKSIREFFRALTRTTLNRQVDIKRALAGLKNKQAQKALSRLITKAGASGLASIRFKIAAKDIYGKLKEADIKILDRIIYARRIISINENRAMKGLEPYRGMSGYSEVNAQQDLNDIKNEIGEEKFNDLNERAGKYFDVFKKNLKKLKDSGRISEEVYNDLNEIEYSPIATIKYIISDNIDVTDMDREASRLGISKEDIKKLTDRNENGIITDSRYLLAMNISSVESRAFENAMLNEVVKALDEATTEQQVALSEYVVFDNPIIGSFKDGRPKRKYDDQAVPNGFKKVYYFENGIEKYIIVREDMARQLLDVKNSKMQASIENVSKTVPVIGWALKTITLTPARLLRFFATGGNPLFILGNVAVDWVNAVFNTDVYSNLKAYGMVQAGLGFAKNFIKKAVTNDTFNKTYNEFAEHGGLMDFLSNESMRALNELKPGHKIFSPLHKVVEMYGTVMSFLGETSEVAMRLAVYEKMKSNLVSEFKKENGVDPNAQQMDDIMWEAAREARELIDFNQGGSWAKEADVVMPYLNAALQGFRKPIEYAKKNPVGFASSYIQLAGMGASIAAMSLAAAMNAMPSDDDDEEKKKKIRKALDSISDHEKASYHIIFTGKVDKNGELQYIRIKKLPVASVATTYAEQMMYKYLVDYKFDEATFNQTIEKSLPFSISELESKNPVVSGYLTYKYNEDTFTGEKVFRGPKDKVILETAEGVNDPKIEAFYKSVAPVFGLSPARSKAFVEKIITNQSTNPTINIFYAAANGIFGKDTQFGTEFSTAMEKMKEAAGKKLIRYTNENVLKYKKEDELEKEKVYITTEKYLKDSKIKADIKSRYNEGKTMTVGELIKIVKENYEPIDQERYFNKYYTYTQTMNTNPALLDLLYEDDPNIQALMINDMYGPNLDKEEMNELGEVMNKSRMKVSDKTWYIYQNKYKNRK